MFGLFLTPEKPQKPKLWELAQIKFHYHHFLTIKMSFIFLHFSSVCVFFYFTSFRIMGKKSITRAENCIRPYVQFWPKFWLKCRFLTKISIFDQNVDLWSKCRFLSRMSIFDKNVDSWPKCRFLTKMSISDQNVDFWPKYQVLKTMSDFWPKYQVLTTMSDFWPNI